MAPRRRTGNGFSIMEMNDDIKDAAGTLIKALTAMGVDVNEDALFLGIQNLVSQVAMSGGNMMADDGAPKYMPYSMTADFLASAFQHHCNGDTREGLKLVIQAFDLDDADTLFHGLTVMNNNSEVVKKLEADEAAASGETPADGDEAELSNAELDALINDDQENNEGDENPEGENEPEETPETPPSTTKGPMNPDAPATPVTASLPLDRAQRIMAAKLSSSGDPADRQKAQRLLSR